MQVKVKAKTVTEEQAQQLGTDYQAGDAFNVEVGRTYTVFGLQIWSGITWLVLSESVFEYLVFVPLLLCEVVDGRASQYWYFRMHDNGNTTLWPRLFEREYFFDDLMENVPEVVTEFRTLHALMVAENLHFDYLDKH